MYLCQCSGKSRDEIRREWDGLYLLTSWIWLYLDGPIGDYEEIQGVVTASYEQVLVGFAADFRTGLWRNSCVPRRVGAGLSKLVLT